MYYKLIFVFLTILRVVNTYNQTCKFISDVKVAYSAASRYYNIIRVSGCITKTSFKDDDVYDITFFCSDSKYLPVLEKNSINNMQALKEISIPSSELCELEIIEPGAFFNLPQLIQIEISNQPLRIISAGVFNAVPSIKTIDFSLNQISEIEDDTFSNSPNLTYLYLQYNKLKHIKKKWFINTTNIEAINLSYNSIRVVPFGIFHKLKKLNYLELSFNYISTTDEPLLKNHVPHMHYVGLECNLIKAVSLDLFSESISFEHIALSGNRLNYLPDDLLNNLRVTDIDLVGNPFTCPCYDNIYLTFYKRNVRIDFYVKTDDCKNTSMPVCGLSLNNTCVEAVDKEVTVRFVNYREKARCDTLSERYQQCAAYLPNYWYPAYYRFD